MWEAIWHMLEHLAGRGDGKAQKVLEAARAAADEADHDATTAANAAELAEIEAEGRERPAP